MRIDPRAKALGYFHGEQSSDPAMAGLDPPGTAHRRVVSMSAKRQFPNSRDQIPNKVQSPNPKLLLEGFEFLSFGILKFPGIWSA
jgi:hypothetical protein